MAATTRSSHLIGPAVMAGLGIGVVVGLVPAFQDSSAVAPLVASAACLLTSAVVAWRCEPRAIGAALASVAILCYFPLRGLVLLAGAPDGEDGVNAQVSELLTASAARTTGAAVLLITLSSLAGYVLCRTLIGRARGSRAPRSFAPPESMAPLALGLLGAGCVGLVIQASTSVAFLRFGSSGGAFLNQLGGALAYCAGFGILATPTVPSLYKRRAFYTLLTIALAIGLVGGSKDIVAKLLVALLLRHMLARWEPSGSKPSSTRRLAVPMALFLVVFIVFPAINSYRRSIQQGSNMALAAAQIPGDLSTNSIVTDRPRSERGLQPYGYDALLFLTNRLHGYDSLLLGVSRGHDENVLTARSALTSPLGALLPTRVIDPDNQEVGLLFAHDYWGLPEADPTRIAIGVFTQVYLAFGWSIVAVVGLMLGVSVFITDRLLASGSVTRVMAGYALLLGVLGMERDLVFVVATTGRHLLVLALVSRLLRTRRGTDVVEGLPSRSLAANRR